jgi:hypothetical protein
VTEIYTRGTTTERVKTARLVPGQRVLTVAEPRPVPASAHTLAHMSAPAAQVKTGAAIRTVDHLAAFLRSGNGFYGRAQREYTVYFTDGTCSKGNAPIYTWHVVTATPTA